MARDILKEIVDRRVEDMAQFGAEFGCAVPAERVRKVHPFIAKKGAILEIKRASPSKGDIAPSLDAAKTAVQYAMAGARAISCLTEMNYFKGSLTDFMAAAAALDDFEAQGNEVPALLRKDFLVNAKEVEVSYRAGADAVLLIARILTAETMLEMAQTAERLGISVLIEVRKNEDLEKLSFVMERVNHKNIVCGVNSRDLKDFSIDMLAPAGMLDSIRKIAPDARVTFESGILSPKAATRAGSMGFSAILLGEAAAKNPAMAGEFTAAFEGTCENAAGRAWVDYAALLNERRVHGHEDTSGGKNGNRPFVKICGLTRKEDAVLAAELGADFLGFIFYGKSKRNVCKEAVREIAAAVREGAKADGKNCGAACPKLVGVIVEPESAEGKAAFELVREGVLDFVQFHACNLPAADSADFSDIPRYAAINVAEVADLQKLDELVLQGEPRVLIDAKTEGFVGGTGKTISAELVEQAAKKVRLWLAGGITAENISEIIKRFQPELIDVATGVECAPGVKDAEKLKLFFSELNKITK